MQVRDINGTIGSDTVTLSDEQDTDISGTGLTNIAFNGLATQSDTEFGGVAFFFSLPLTETRAQRPNGFTIFGFMGVPWVP